MRLQGPQMDIITIIALVLLVLSILAVLGSIVLGHFVVRV